MIDSIRLGYFVSSRSNRPEPLLWLNDQIFQGKDVEVLNHPFVRPELCRLIGIELNEKDSKRGVVSIPVEVRQGSVFLKPQPTIVFIGGYARSGKTTLLNALAAKGLTVLSTSQKLDILAVKALAWLNKHSFNYRDPILNKEALLSYIFDNSKPTDWDLVQRLRRKSLEDTAILSSLGVSDCRRFKIWLAEEVIVPRKGRLEGLIRPVFEDYQDNPDADQNLAFMETIGGEEHFLAKHYLAGQGYRVVNLNLRSSTEEKGVDIRRLLPDAVEYKFCRHRFLANLSQELDVIYQRLDTLQGMPYSLHSYRDRGYLGPVPSQ